MCTDGTHAAAFNARTSGQNAAHLDANCNFINGLDTDSLYASADLIYLLATDTAPNARLNITSASFTITEVNSPVFTVDSGYTVGGTSTANLDTGFNIATNGVAFLQNSASAAIWTLTNFVGGTDYKHAVGTHQATPSTIILPAFSTGPFTYFMRINSTVNQSNSTLGHFYYIERDASNGATGEDGYINTTTFGTGDTSLAPPSVNLILLNSDAGGTANSNPFGGNIAFFWAGGTLGVTKQALLCHRVNLYLTTIAGAGAGVC
jgi:hypothetical protein